MIFWNSKFVRGLAESVLERARVIRAGLGSYSAPSAAAKAKRGRKVLKKRRPARKRHA